MTLQELNDIANLFASHTNISASRVSDNVILLRLDSINYNIDLNKTSPRIYINNEIIKPKMYNAPFDIALQKYLQRATLLSCRLDNMNKILILKCQNQNKYKSTQITLYLEFIPRLSNAVIVKDDIVVSALRFFSDRNALHSRFSPLPQPKFNKILESNSIDSTKKMLENNYKNLQNELLESRRQILSNQCKKKLEKLDSILRNLPNIAQLEAQKTQNIMLANYILANLDSIPKYASKICVNGVDYEIPSLAKSSLVSDKLFKNAKKLKQKIQNINLQIQNLESKISFLQKQMKFIEKANLGELAILDKSSVKQANLKNKNSVKKQYESFFIESTRISVGRNASENIKVLQDSKADFYWLHILDVPSSHLIIHSNKLDSNILLRAGTFLAKLNGISGKVVIDYTKRKFVKLSHTSHVTYSKAQKLHLDIR